MTTKKPPFIIGKKNSIGERRISGVSAYWLEAGSRANFFLPEGKWHNIRDIVTKRVNLKIQAIKRIANGYW